MRSMPDVTNYGQVVGHAPSQAIPRGDKNRDKACMQVSNEPYQVIVDLHCADLYHAGRVNRVVGH